MKKYLMKKEYKRKVLYQYIYDENEVEDDFNSVTNYPFNEYKWEFRILRYEGLRNFMYSSYLKYPKIKKILIRQKKYRKVDTYKKEVKIRRYFSLRRDHNKIYKQIEKLIEEFDGYF